MIKHSSYVTARAARSIFKTKKSYVQLEMGDDSPSRKSAMDDKADAIPNELLGLVFVRLNKPVDLVRAAMTRRRWRHIIVAESFRVLCALHDAPSTKVAGSYLIDERSHGWRMPGRHPVFFHLGRGPPQGIWRSTSSLGRKMAS
jgi:hypothetical protein